MSACKFICLFTNHITVQNTLTPQRKHYKRISELFDFWEYLRQLYAYVTSLGFTSAPVSLQPHYGFVAAVIALDFGVTSLVFTGFVAIAVKFANTLFGSC